jgi:hypothetical protein
MIYVAAQDSQTNSTKVFLAKNKKALKDMGFKWIRNFPSETKAVIWINESYLNHEKEFLY